jgi:hypothetical protein
VCSVSSGKQPRYYTRGFCGERFAHIYEGNKLNVHSFWGELFQRAYPTASAERYLAYHRFIAHNHFVTAYEMRIMFEPSDGQEGYTLMTAETEHMGFEKMTKDKQEQRMFELVPVVTQSEDTDSYELYITVESKESA